VPGVWWELGGEEVAVKASVGDRITVLGHQVGERKRDGEVLEVRGDDGGPPYVVRWEDGHESLFFPGNDANIKHFKDEESSR